MQLLSKEQKDEECDARDDDSSTSVWPKKNPASYETGLTFYKLFIILLLSVSLLM